MTLDEKLDQFYHAAIESATGQNLQIVEEYQKSLQAAYEDHKKEALKKAEAAYRAESEKLLREKNRELSAEAIRLKRKINEKSVELADKLFGEITGKLTAFMAGPEYFDLLCRQIRNAVNFAKGDSMTIYINPSDSSLKAALESETKAALTVSTRDFTGGIRAVIHDKNILIDHSFLTKLEELRTSCGNYSGASGNL